MSSLAIVTGAPGWLGTCFVRALESGLEGVSQHPELARKTPGLRVRCLVQPGLDTRALEGAEIVQGDLTREEDVARLFEGARGATVFHIAGVVHPRLLARDFSAVNVMGTANLLAAAKKAGVRRFVYMSSNSAVGVSKRPDETFDESSACRPYLGYGKSKREAEKLVSQAFDRRELETVIVRAPWFYGPNQPARQALFLRMVARGTVPLVGSGNNRRSMAYIDNLCQGLLLAANVPAAAGRTYWIADRHAYTMNEIVDTIERVLVEAGIRVAHRRIRLPGAVSGAARLADRAIQSLGLYHQKMHVLGEMDCTIACSVALAERELGYAPAVDLEEGMRRTVAEMVRSGFAF